MNILAKHPKQNLSTPFFIALILLAMSLPLSKYTTGLFQFILLIVWLADGLRAKSQSFKESKFSFHYLRTIASELKKNFLLKILMFWNNKTTLILVSLYLLFLTAFIQASDTNYILTDLRIKLPLLFLPLILVSMPALSNRQLSILFLFYIGAVLAASVFSAIELFSKNFADIREISVFISPVRFGLNICFSLVLLADFIFKNNKIRRFYKLLFIIIAAWLIFILFKMESGIGILIFSFLILLFVVKQIFISRTIVLKIVLGVLLVFGLISAFFYVDNEINLFYNTAKNDFSKMDSTTKLGNHYVHDTINYAIENGKFLGLYLCEEELKNTWESRSSLDYNGVDKKGQLVRSTLIRFLTSKNFRKDEQGVKQLTNKEIKYIENGIANAAYIYNPGLSSRISKILFGYETYLKTNDPNGNSIAQRIEYWTASIKIIKGNFWWGVGSGNIPLSFENQYISMGSKLLKKNWMESHNQYLLIFASFGVFGFIWFLFVLIYPGIKSKAIYDVRYFAFLLIILISMLTEDTLETQTGLTFFAFFNALLILSKSSAPLPEE